MKKSTPSQAYLSWQNASYLGHKFCLPPIGTIAEIKQILREMLRLAPRTQTTTSSLISIFVVLFSFFALGQGTSCGSATNLNVGSTCVNTNYSLATGGTALTTVSCGPALTGRVGWYKFTATNSTITIKEINTTNNVNRTISVWTSCSNGSQLTSGCSYATNGATNTLALTGLLPGQVYYIMIRSSVATTSNGTICVYAINTSPCSASTLTVNSSCITTAGSTNGLTNSSVSAPSCGNYFGQDAWYKVVVPAMGYLIFETSNLSSSSAAMAIYSGSCGSVTEIDCNVNTASAGISNYTYIGAALTPGDTIFIRVWKTSSSGGLNLSYNICVHTPNCTSNTTNDFCEGAATLTENASANFGSNTNLYTNDNPGDVEVPFSCGTIQNNSWYSFVASSTTATFPFSYTNAGCTAGIQAEVFEFNFINGCCIEPISKSNCESLNNTNPFTLNATGLVPGETYYLMVDGYNGAVCNFSISGWSAIGVLPVKLIEFKGEAESRMNLLKWRTASEINSDEMIIEKSEDGINFTAIGSVKAAGNSTTENKYLSLIHI